MPGPAARADRIILGMGVVDSLIRARSPRFPESVRVADALRADPAGGLSQLVRFTEGLDTAYGSPDTRLAALDPVGVAWRAALGRLLQPLRSRPIPFDTDELTALHRAARASRSLREAYKRIHADLRTDADSAPSPRALLALARALDAQSRLLVAACRLRVAMPREDWDELCRLGYPLWAARVFDEAFPDGSVAIGDRRAATPRAALTRPILLRLLEPLGLHNAALELAYSVSDGVARRTGVKIDVDGMPHVSRDGPALMVSAHHTVQFDTRAAAIWLQRSRDRVAKGASAASIRLRTSLGTSGIDALFASLGTVWGTAYVPTPLVRPPLSQALMHIGLPERPRPPTPTDPVAVGELDPRDSSRVVADAVYVYGRGTYPGRSGPGREVPEVEDPSARDAAFRAVMRVSGIRVAWRGRDARRSVFARTVASPRLRIGQLVAVLPVRAADSRLRAATPRPGSGPTRPMLGRVATLSHTGVPDGREPYGHDVGVVFWPGAPVPVRVRIGPATVFEDAWWFPVAMPGMPTQLVLRRDRFEAVEDVLIREPAGDRELRLIGLIERGTDYDRVEVDSIG